MTCGEHQQFERQVLRYQGALFAFLGRMGFTQAVAEELAQETFLRAWRARSRFDPDRGAYSTWLFTIARNLGVNELSRAARRSERPDLDRVNETASSASATESADRADLQRRLRQALATLEPDERAVIALGQDETLSAADAAALAGCTPGAFRTRLSRARHRLRAAWNESP